MCTPPAPQSFLSCLVSDIPRNCLHCFSRLTGCDGGGRGRHTLGTEELAGDVEGLAADDDDLLAVEELLSNDRGETAKEMTLAVDDDL